MRDALARWAPRFALVTALGLLTWTLLHQPPPRGRGQHPNPQTPVQGQPSHKPRPTLDGELLS